MTGDCYIIPGKSPKRLMPFAGNPRLDMPPGLPFVLTDYIDLVDVTGRQITKNNIGIIDNTVIPILERLNFTPQQWVELSTSFESWFSSAAGNEEHLTEYQQKHQLKHIRGISNARRLFNSA